MKRLRDEKGYVLVLVLILLLIGALIITPLLAYMGTVLKAGQTNEQLMLRYYAADAGVEDAIWKLKYGEVPETMPYTLMVNDKYVAVDIALEEDMQGFLSELLDRKLTVSPSGHGGWAIVTHIIEEGTYTISVSYNGSAGTKYIRGVGAWLAGDYSCTDNSSGDDDITDSYIDYEFKQVGNAGSGTAFIWEWPPGERPGFQPGDNKTQSFTFTPSVEPEFYISWVDTGSMDIGVVTSGEDFGIYRVTSTATDNITGKQTEINSYVLMLGVESSIITWQTSLK